VRPAGESQRHEQPENHISEALRASGVRQRKTIANFILDLRGEALVVALKKRPKNKAEGEKEGVALEADFQSLLASELHHHSQGRYSITVEPHTAESKRRDVLCSKGDMFASIELKMSMRWPLDKYEEALEKQLVGQYMRHRKATTGFLVIVLQEEGRTWNDSKTGGKVDFKGLLAMLSEKALRLESRDRRRYLRVIGIDATKPKDFRAAATKSTAKSAAAKPSRKTVAPAKRVLAVKKAVAKVSKNSVDAVLSGSPGLKAK
jgi:hypothetical protein